MLIRADVCNYVHFIHNFVGVMCPISRLDNYLRLRYLFDINSDWIFTFNFALVSELVISLLLLSYFDIILLQ